MSESDIMLLQRYTHGRVCDINMRTLRIQFYSLLIVPWKSESVISNVDTIIHFYTFILL